MSCGIYKIVSPSGKVYIGESVDIKRRWKHYKLLNCKEQIKLFNSLAKYGVENHIFEIIEECPLEELKCRERYYQDSYDVLNKGLNCKLTECGEQKQTHSSDTIERMSKSKLGKLNPNFGKKWSEESTKKRNKNRKCTKGTKMSEESKINMSLNHADVEWGSNPNAKTVLCLTNGIFYSSLKEACFRMNLKYNTEKKSTRENRSKNFKKLDDEL